MKAMTTQPAGLTRTNTLRFHMAAVHVSLCDRFVKSALFRLFSPLAAHTTFLFFVCVLYVCGIRDTHWRL
ncbi:hypothetical protein P8C59_001345 [Phyllachora maydis]|uniref:Uncharacterized protein n=1 Tax=Phyllachora maydis TaxID=1825666 RepID=A0AAD9MBA0_9PEZI|nr:hypothetical protein P8C59_001345 [Phyllachora maydis]